MKNLWLMLVMTSSVVLVAGLWIPLKAIAAQELLELAWANTEATQSRSRPWPWADTWPVARLELPGLSSPLVVLAGGHGESLAFGPGQVAGPDVGQPLTSPVVIAGHRDTHFRALQKLQADEVIRLQFADGIWRSFRIDQMKVVDSSKEQLDLSLYHRGSLVLVTCYPFDALDAGGPLRFVVEASRDLAWPAD
ncbi:class GN sortase [uncultured Marinobacter sp.]|uniref:class GN sortase n=1 Tax=uncultured Marinobacter sp. TaxID=187379 RepID=UPI0030D8DB53